MDPLVFSNNWNNKLNCDVFTTIRLKNEARYYKGNRFGVVLSVNGKTADKGIHEVVDVRHVLLKDLPSYVAWCDTGYDAAQTRDLIKTMYRNSRPTINWDSQELAIVLLKKVNRNQQELFADDRQNP